MKKLIGILLTVAMMVTLLPASVFATDGEMTVYQSSTNFSTESGDGTWDDGIWAAQVLNPDTDEYTNLTYQGTYDNWSPNFDEAADVYTVDANMNDHIVSAYRMQPPANGRWAKPETRTHYVVKTFTAPKAGSITITSDKGVTPADGSKPKIRIRKGNANGTITVLFEETQLGNSGVSTDTGAINTTIEEGETIHFEMLRTAAYKPEGSTESDGKFGAYVRAYWDPVITYKEVGGDDEDDTEEADPNKTKFISSENFGLTSSNGTWGGVWSANLLDTTNDVYSPMTSKSDTFWASGRSSVNGTELRAECGNNIGEGYLTLSAVKTFTAPKDGTVKISYAELTHTGSVDIKGGVIKYAYNQGVKFRVRVQSGETVNKIYPKDAEYLEKAKNASDLYMIEANTVTNIIEVKTGDKIHFEQMRTIKDNAWQGIFCDPVIEYTDEKPDDNGDNEDDGEGDTPAEKTKYVSSENFSVTAEDGTWDGVWSANKVDFNTNTYTALSADGNVWRSGNVMVDATRLIPFTGGKADVKANNHIGAAKTFTAPTDGYVQISYAKIYRSDKSAEYGISVHQPNRQMSFRVRLESNGSFEKVYPKTADYLESRLNDYTSYEMIAADTVVATVQINKGDKLHFEVKKTLANDEDNWNGIHCDPVVQYVDEADVPQTSDPADKKVYKASESFNDIENGDYAWKWQYYDVIAREYKNLTHISVMQGFGIDKEEKAPIWYLPQNTEFNKDRGISVGAVGMRVSIDEPDDVATEGEKNGEIERSYPVKSFTAPKSGLVEISAAVFEPGHSSGGAAIRLVKHSLDGTQTKLYPEDAEWITILPGDTIPSIKTELAKGEILTFENALWKNNSAWHAIIRWDPVITYTKLVPVLDSCNTEAGAKEVPLNKEHILTFSGDVAAPEKSEIKVYEINGSNKTESSAKAKSVVADGKNLKIVFEGLKAYTKYEIEVGGVAFKATPGDTTKVALSFKTGPVVNVLSVEYKDGKVKAVVNNSADTPATATLAAFLCKGSEDSYTIEKTCIATDSSVGASEPIEISLTIPSGDYFVKALVLEDVLAAKAYAPITILKGDK